MDYQTDSDLDLENPVWSGTLHRQGKAKISLVPDRAERWDTRYSTTPSFDLEEDDGKGSTKELIEKAKVRRKYTRTGKHVGKFSRTDPSARHYKPTIRKGS